jgi:hypothetical protein
VLPDGAGVASVLLDGAPAPFVLVQTTRGTEVRVAAGAATGTHTLTINLG